MGTRADDIMVRTMRGLFERNPQLPLDQIDDVAIAAATQTGDQGMNIGRSASLLAGIPNTVPGYSVDRWCAGAMTSVTTLSGAIAMGTYDIAIAGGVEHMGNHPMGELMDPNPRYLAEKLVEGDALAMGNTAERLHDKFPHLTKERADAYALASQQKTAAAYAAGEIQRDLIPVAVRNPELGYSIATVDEAPRPTTTMEGLAGLKTPFRAAGRVTPGNASGLNDGATAAILASEEKALELGLPIKAKLVTFAFAGVEPEIMGYGPVPSTIKALKKAGLSIEDIGLFEVNEAFAIQVLAFLDHFGIADDDPRVNIHGGAIAVGHPLASSGIRLMLNLARGFELHPEVRYGLTTMCIGLGMGGTVIWENPHFNGTSGKVA
jgi:acetyl-CoA acyltransferase